TDHQTDNGRGLWNFRRTSGGEVRKFLEPARDVFHDLARRPLARRTRCAPGRARLFAGPNHLLNCISTCREGRIDVRHGILHSLYWILSTRTPLKSQTPTADPVAASAHAPCAHAPLSPRGEHAQCPDLANAMFTGRAMGLGDKRQIRFARSGAATVRRDQSEQRFWP